METKGYFLILSLLFIWSGCEFTSVNDASNDDPSIQHQALNTTPSDTPIVTPHEKFAEIAEIVPGFGGIYLDEMEYPNIYLKDPSDRDGAIRVLKELMTVDEEKRIYTSSLALRDLSELVQNMKIHQAKYDYAELWANLQKVYSLIGSQTDIKQAGISSRDNALKIGLAPTTTEQAILSDLATIAVPEDMITYFTAGDFKSDKGSGFANSAGLPSLDDKVRPIAGGLQIQVSGDAPCSLGFFAQNEYVGFVTASHCTPFVGIPEFRQTGQPLASSGYHVGYEQSDSYFRAMGGLLGCPSGARCSFADATFISFQYGTSNYAAGKIVIADATGTLISTDPDDWVSIVGVCANPIEGDNVEIYGRSVVHEEGEVTDVCIGPAFLQTNPGSSLEYWTVCQVKADYFSAGGDSGGPVVQEVGENVALLYGIHSGQDDSDGKRIFSQAFHASNELTVQIITLSN